MSKKSSNFAPAFAPKTEGKQKMILERLINQDVVQEREYGLLVVSATSSF
jgi:hypothetical protein